MMKKVMTALLLIVYLLALPLGLAGCAQVELAGLEVAGEVPVLAPGGSAPVALSYSFTTEAPSEEQIAKALEQVTLVWASGDEAVATVDEAGVVTAVAPGSTQVTVGDSAGLYTATVPVTVVQPLEDATVQDTVTLDLLAGETAQLAVEQQPADATGVEVTFASGDETVVTVSADGALTPVAEGEAVVTTTVTGDGLDGPVERVLTTTVTVAVLPQGIELESAEGLLVVGYSTVLVPHTLPEEAPASTYTYTSSDETVAMVDADGTVKAVAMGTCTITVTSAEGHTAEYALTVTAAPRNSGGSNYGGRTGSTTGSSSGGTSGNGGGTGGDSGNGSDGHGSGYRPPNPNGDGSPGNPIDGGAAGIPDDGQTTKGWE